MKRSRTVAIAVVLGSGALWLLFGEAGRGGEVSEAPIHREGAVDPRSAALEQAPSETLPGLALDSTRSAVEHATEPPADSAAPIEPAGHPQLRVLVVDEATGVVVPGIGASLESLASSTAKLRGESDRTGWVAFEDLASGEPYRLRLATPLQKNALVVEELEPFEPGEVRELTRSIDISAFPTCWFRCVAFEDGRVVPGARVWRYAGASAPATERPWQVGEPLAIADANGIVAMRAWNGWPSLAFEAEGYAPGFASQAVGGESADAPTEIQLAAPATLEVSLRRPNGSALSDRTVVLRIEAHELGLGALKVRLVSMANAEHRWEQVAVTDSAGLAVFPVVPARTASTGLMPNRDVEGVVGTSEPLPDEGVQLGFEPMGAEPLRFVPGEARRVEYVLGGSARVTGVVVDRAGAPVADQTLWLLRALDVPRAFVSPRDAESAVRKLQSGAQGRFELEGVPFGRWELFVAAVNGRYASGASRVGAAPNGTAFEVGPGTHDLTLQIVTDRGLAIRGHVWLAGGEPAPNVSVEATAAESSFAQRTSTDGEGAFVVGPLFDELYDLSTSGLRWEGSGNLPKPVRASPGDDVDLRLVTGGGLRGRTVGGPNEIGCSVRLQLLLSGTDGPPRGSPLVITQRGPFRFDSLAPGTYTVVARGANGQIAVSTGNQVVADQTSAEIELRLAEGGALRVRSAAPSGTAHMLVARRAGDPFHVERLPGGSTIDLPAPQGWVTLELWSAGELVESTTAEARLGEQTEVEVASP